MQDMQCSCGAYMQCVIGNYYQCTKCVSKPDVFTRDNSNEDTTTVYYSPSSNNSVYPNHMSLMLDRKVVPDNGASCWLFRTQPEGCSHSFEVPTESMFGGGSKFFGSLRVKVKAGTKILKVTEL